jgi:hypothetical protein
VNKYTYVIWQWDREKNIYKRIDDTDRLQEALNILGNFDSQAIDGYIKVVDLESGMEWFCFSKKELEDWIVMITSWEEKQIQKNREEQTVTDKINPSHYKEIVPGMQYMQMMQYMLKGYEGVEAHLMGQVYKYQMRNGKKDEAVQELSKAVWYLLCEIIYLKTGKVAVDIDVDGYLKDIAKKL